MLRLLRVTPFQPARPEHDDGEAPPDPAQRRHLGREPPEQRGVRDIVSHQGERPNQHRKRPKHLEPEYEVAGEPLD